MGLTSDGDLHPLGVQAPGSDRKEFRGVATRDAQGAEAQPRGLGPHQGCHSTPKLESAGFGAVNSK